ncbi:hypothetical protein TESS_TESS_01871 [Tessaracoccus sp. O5.2]|uniref:DUF6414 family protein n=1 Tax=Tessaracoccus sp. O5.2 TaxID=3157622 RepID=UPI0035EEF032
MLIQPEYLNSESLEGYISLIEPGVRGRSSRSRSSDSGLQGGVGVSILKAGGNKSARQEESEEYSDHDIARLRRLLDYGRANPEEAAWITVSQPDSDFEGIGLGAFVEWECDISVPDTVAALNKRGQLGEALKLMESFSELADAIGQPIELGIPDEARAMVEIANRIDMQLVIVGEDVESGSPWRIVGRLDDRFLVQNADLDGRYICVGKVRRVIPRGDGYSLANIPALATVQSFANRAERRRAERAQGAASRPKKKITEDDAMTLAGPLAVLDLVAVYR